MTPWDLEHYRVLAEQSPAMIWRAGSDAKREYFNATWLAFTGRTLQEESGEGWLDGVHPDDVEACRGTLVDHVERREPFALEYRLRRSDDVYRYVVDRGRPHVDEEGRRCGFIGSCVEVDPSGSSAAAAGLSDFFNMSLDNVCVAGLDGYFKRVSPSWTKTLGWTNDELLARPSIEFVHPDDREATLAGRERLRRGSALGPLVNRYLCKDGSVRWFEWRSVAHAERELVYAVARDITQQKLAEERLVEAKALQERLQRQLIFAERMASVGTLAAGVAHEINNPLAYVAANIHLLLEELDVIVDDPTAVVPSELRQMALEAQEGAERIRKIVAGLKTFSRAEEERRTVIDVLPLLERSINMTFNEIRHRARLVKEYGAVPLVEADDGRLGQVFNNLLINAAQALPEGALATNEIRVVTSTDAAGRAVIEVRDNGPGIPAELRARVFDPFFTTKAVGVGTGLGLSICHTIVTGLGGEIEVLSEPGRGTTVAIALPAASRARAEVPDAPPLPETLAEGASVLVVDDEPTIGVILRRILREHDVTTVTSARQALDHLRAGRRFDVIFSDLMMPEMSGMDFYDELQRSFPHAVARVVFISGGAFTPLARAFLERVPNRRIDKPFDPEKIREMVNHIVQRSLP